MDDKVTSNIDWDTIFDDGSGEDTVVDEAPVSTVVSDPKTKTSTAYKIPGSTPPEPKPLSGLDMLRGLTFGTGPKKDPLQVEPLKQFDKTQSAMPDMDDMVSREKAAVASKNAYNIPAKSGMTFNPALPKAAPKTMPAGQGTKTTDFGQKAALARTPSAQASKIGSGAGTSSGTPSGASIVKQGDNIWNLFKERYGRNPSKKELRMLTKKNRIRDPRKIPTGTRIVWESINESNGNREPQAAKYTTNETSPETVMPKNKKTPTKKAQLNENAELEALMRKYNVGEVEEADKPTKTKDATDMDWDTVFDEPTSKGELATSKPAGSVPGPQTTADLKRGSRADTARATANINPTDAMRDMMSRINVPMDDVGVDEPTQDVVPYENITPDHVPATISRAIAMTDPHAINPTWHAVANLPGNMSRAILTLGKALFRAFTKTPTEEIVMIGNVGGQGPNSTREVNGVADWIRKNGHEVDDASIDFDQTIPGYRAEVKHYTANGIRFKIVKDQFGDYIYAWPEHDSLNQVAQIGNAPEAPARRPSRSLPRR